MNFCDVKYVIFGVHYKATYFGSIFDRNLIGSLNFNVKRAIRNKV